MNTNLFLKKRQGVLFRAGRLLGLIRNAVEAIFNVYRNNIQCCFVEFCPLYPLFSLGIVEKRKSTNNAYDI